MQPSHAQATRQVRLLGIPLDNLTQEQTLDRIFGDLAAGCGGWALTPNLDILRRLVKDPSYRELTQRATLRLPDGMPLIWASRLQGEPLQARVAGSDLIWTVSARAAREGRSVYFLGGNPGAAESAAAKLQALNPGLRVAGIDCPPLGFERDPEYMSGLRDRLVAAKPDVCFVALTAPKQDLVIRTLLELLPSTWFMGIGISFSFVSGEVKRAPVWMRRVGLEWFHRLAQEPRRLARRYLVDGLPFAGRLFWGAAIARLRSPKSSLSGPDEADGDPAQMRIAREVGKGVDVESVTR
jgi:N-acetylglucosaminyldiphosphoundecaprenol N-acetyl-beta-D-mannosaminyltransferase